jgi:hypothetical protein
MNGVTHLECRASSGLSKHEGESSLGLCDRLDRTRDNSQRQLPTDHDYAVPTREYQTDQSSLKSAQAAARSVLGERQKQRQQQKQPHRFRGVDTVTPYQTNALIEPFRATDSYFNWTTNGLLGHMTTEEIFARKLRRWKGRPDGKRGKHEAVSLSSHSPWKSTQYVDSHITHRTTTNDY